MQFDEVPGQPLLKQMQLFNAEEAAHYFTALLQEVAWNDGFYQAFGRKFKLPRLQAWYADPGINYHYAENLLNSHYWTNTLLTLKQRVNQLTGLSFNAVLVNRYRDGDDSVGWHADDETDLGENPVIASLSLGAQRQFSYRRKASLEVESIALASGSLLLMLPPFQQLYEHAVLVDQEVNDPRINLTFRHVRG